MNDTKPGIFTSQSNRQIDHNNHSGVGFGKLMPNQRPKNDQKGTFEAERANPNFGQKSGENLKNRHNQHQQAGLLNGNLTSSLLKYVF